MDEEQQQRWYRDEAKKAADGKLAQAEKLVEEAAEILRNNGFAALALDATEALEYIHGALGG